MFELFLPGPSNMQIHSPLLNPNFGVLPPNGKEWAIIHPSNLEEKE
jgi:hypothetical protein